MTSEGMVMEETVPCIVARFEEAWMALVVQREMGEHTNMPTTVLQAERAMASLAEASQWVMTEGEYELFQERIA